MMQDKLPKLTKDLRRTAIDALGDPRAMTVEAQHDVVLRTVFQSLELARLAGFRADAIAEAGAAAVVSYAANLGQMDRNAIAASLRKSADSIQTTDADDVTEH